MPRRRFQPGVSNHPKPRGRPTRFPRFIQEARFLSNLPIAEEAGLPIFLLTTKRGVDEHKIYILNRNNTLQLVSTNEFGIAGLNGSGTGFSFSGTAKRLGNSHYILIGNGLWRSRNQCVTWEQVVTYNNGEAACFAIDAGGRIWFFAELIVASGGLQHVRYSDDDGDNWTDLGITAITDLMDIFELVPHPIDPNLIFGFGDDFVDGPTVIYTTDRGENWNFFPLGLNGNFEYSGFEVKDAILTSTGRLLLIVPDVTQSNNPLYVYYSDDPTSGITSFTQVLLGNHDEGDWFNPVISLSAEGNKIFAFGGEFNSGVNEQFASRLWQSLDNGGSWEEFIDDVHYPTRLSYEHTDSGFYDEENDRLVIITTGAFDPQTPGNDDAKIWVSKPPGQNWQDITPEEDLSFSAFMVIWR